MTDFSNVVPGASYRELIEDVALRQVKEEFENALQLTPLIGKPGSDMPIIKNVDLVDKGGDTIQIPMYGNFTGVGKLGDIAIEDSEEVLVPAYQKVYVNQWRQAFRDAGAMTRQRDQYDIHSIANKRLAKWDGQNVERALFYTMYYNYSPHLLPTAATYGGIAVNSSTSKPARYWYCADEENNPLTYSATDATYIANIKASEGGMTDVEGDYFSPDIIEGVVAKMIVRNVPKCVIDPVGECYVCFIHPYQTVQLRNHTKWFTSAENAIPRSLKDNPIFSRTIMGKAVAYFNNTLVIESNFVHSGDETKFNTAWSMTTVEVDSNAASVYRAIFMGREAVFWAIADEAKIKNARYFDYGNKFGEAIASIWGAAGTHYVTDDANATIIEQNRTIVSSYSPTAVV